MTHLLRNIKRMALCLAALTWLAACTVKVPSHVIQPDEMEDLLYDYHLMQALAGDLRSSETYKSKQYEQYVFDKHRVTEAEFDTSLTWYMRHTKELEEIYKNLNRRFTAKKDELAAHIPPYERVVRVSEVGDTVNVWDDFRLARLTTSPIANKLTFTLKPDSNYHARDSFEWKLDALFLGDTSASRAVMAMALLYDKDTVGQSQQIDRSGSYALSLAIDSSHQLKEIHGHVYYYNRYREDGGTATSNDSLPEFRVLPVADLLLSDIAIMRYHRKDSIATDTTAVPQDTLSASKRAIEPEEFKTVK